MVVARIEQDGKTQLLVAPVTHSKPDRAEDGIEMPARVRKHLGLDGERSWIILTELNRFIWPGPDVRTAAGGDSPLYGAIPGQLFEQVRNGITRQSRGSLFGITKRTE